MGAGSDNFPPLFLNTDPMNDNRHLLRNVDYSLHDPALEALRVLALQRIEVRCKVHKKATVEQKAKSVELELLRCPVNVTNAPEQVETALATAVDYYNALRKKQVRSKGMKLMTFEPKEKEQPTPAH